MADMETMPTKQKPVPAPKPVARFSNSNQDEKKVGLEARNSSVRREQHEIAEVIGRKTDKDGAITIHTHNASASQLPPKPAILPKPQTPLKPCIRGRQQLPHHSNSGGLQPSIAQDHRVVKPKSILSPLKIKAPVAKLDEFDSLYEPVASPVRPSRSPKMKMFPEGPFKTSEVRPELPVKKRLLSSGTVADTEVKDWDHIKKRSSSLGRTGITSLLEERVKSLSLSRSLCPSEAFNWTQTRGVTPGTGMKVGPVPPPRRRKRSEGALNNCADFTTIHPSSTPVYAQVNYEMKKNRREVASLPVAYSQLEVETFEENAMPILTGELLLAGNKIERNNFIKVDPMHTSVELVPSANSAASVNISEAELVAEQGSSDPITECGVILKDKVEVQVDTEKVCLSADAVGVTTVITQQCTEDNSDQVSTVAVCEDILTGNLIPQHSALHCIIGSILQVSQETDSSSNEGSILQASQVTGANNKDRTTTTIEPRKSELYCLQQLPTEKQDIAASVIYTSYIAEEIVTSDSIEHRPTAIDTDKHSPKDVDEVVQVQCEDVNYPSISSIYPYPRPISTAQVSKVPYLVNAEERTETMSEKAVYFEAASSSTGAVSKLNRDGPVKLWRRQSWSSSKDTTPSPDRESVRKQKHNSTQNAWCDDGELSNGALADSDTGSSDNTGRKSQEDVATGNGPYVRSKIGLWFDSFGKGSKRKERKIRANSSFYNDEKALATSSSTGSKSPLPDTTEVRTSRVVLLRPDSSVGVVRSPSRVSSTLDDMEPPEPWDSESDNEEHANQNHSRLSDEQRKERKAFFIARELMTSECQFVGVLKLLNIDFIQAVKEYPVIPDLELAKISNGLPQLYELNKLLLEDLEERIKNWKSNPKIADVIVQTGPFLKLYSSYIKNFETQCNYLDECCQKYPHFGKVVKAFEASPICKKLKVKHFMLKPVQRIPQYRMLLEDYQRNLAPNSADFADTATALTIVREVADHANRTIKLGDHLSKLIDLQSQIIDYEIIKPGRVFLKDGELFKLSRKVRHPRYFILLNDCLLYTTRQSTSFLRLNTELPLDGMKVCIPQVEDNLNEFNIISVTRSFTLSATSVAERQDWIEALDTAIKDHASRKLTFSAAQVEAAVESEPLKLGHQAPVWIQDARVTMCQSCTTPFTVMFRRHHCRACGKVVCGHCSDNRAPLRYKHFQSQRVCDDCHQKIREEFDGPESKSIMQEVMHDGGFRTLNEAIEATKAMFKKSDSGAKKKILLQNKKEIPQRLKEVAANDSGSQMSGWLHRKSRRSWKRLWFVLKDQVLYVYRASEDVVALESMPILGYTVEPMTERHFQIYEGIDATLVFQLAHDGQLPLVFHADSPHLANRWMACMEEATKLH